jgi:riboflavin biosynthesis pyrimidine reductase
VLVEGGKTLHESFLNTDNWDELRRIIALDMNLPDGYPAPVLPGIVPAKSEQFMSDRIDYFLRPE